MLGCSEHNLMKNALVNLGQGMTKSIYIYIFFSCGAVAQRRPGPPHS